VVTEAEVRRRRRHAAPRDRPSVELQCRADHGGGPRGEGCVLERLEEAAGLSRPV
jgi:hypothetical protein